MSVGAAAALFVGLTGAVIVACYDLPKPDCGFVCGPDNACPSSYTCADDHYCHRVGAPEGPICAPPDGPRPVDAPPDAPPDAPIDAPPDAPIDAPPEPI